MNLDTPVVLAQIKKARERWPNQRVAQIIHNALTISGRWRNDDTFYAEDTELVEALAYYANPEKCSYCQKPVLESTKVRIPGAGDKHIHRQCHEEAEEEAIQMEMADLEDYEAGYL